MIRPSLGMAVTMSLTSTVHTVWQLVLVATQTPKDRSFRVLGTLSTGVWLAAWSAP